MGTGRLRLYWDTAPLVTWITEEKRQDPAELAGIAAVAAMVDRGRAILMTSVLWRSEVLDLNLTVAQKRRIEAAFDGQSIAELAIDSRVMDLAGEIRSYHKKSTKKDAMKNIRVPDPIHLASAIHYEADEFHTFDGARQGKNPGGLLTLNGNVAGRRLKICVPRADQYLLDFSSDESAGGRSE
jgi:predicted nucleic acid-binding protein